MLRGLGLPDRRWTPGRDPKAVRELTARSAKLHAELLSRWDSLSEQYREALGEITSPEAWAKTFEDNPPVDVQR